MKARRAIEILKNAAWLGTNTDRERIEEAVQMAVSTLEKEAWKEEHPVSPLHLKKHSDPPTEDNSCMYCNNRMSCYRYITWLGDPLDLFAPKVDGCDKFDKNKN